MKKYLLLLLLPLFALSCSSDDDVETIEDRIKKSIVESMGVENLVEYTQAKEVGKYEDSEMYKLILDDRTSVSIDNYTLTIPELIEYYKEFHTETMYNCFVKWKADEYTISQFFCVNSNEIKFVFGVDSNTSSTNREKIKEIVKSQEGFDKAENFHYFQKSNNEFEYTSLYKHYKKSLDFWEQSLQELKEQNASSILIQQAEKGVKESKQKLEYIRNKFTIPYYTVNFANDKNSSSKTILHEAYLDDKFELIDQFK